MKKVDILTRLFLLVPLVIGYKCDESYWPNFYNTGSSDTTLCATSNKSKQLMVIGGISEEVQAGIDINTGFAYALDFDGNWMWSHKFTDGLDSIS